MRQRARDITLLPTPVGPVHDAIVDAARRIQRQLAQGE